MGISVLKNAAVEMAAVHQWMDHVTVPLVTQGHTVISRAQLGQLDLTAPNIATVQRMEPATSSLEDASRY